MKRLSILVFISAMAVAMWALPARRDGRVVTQPDGTKVTIYQHGDEYFHWITNEKGEWVKMDEDGYYRVTEALSTEEIAVKRMASPMRTASSAYPLNIAPRGLVILVEFQDIKFTTSKAAMDSMLTGKNYTRDYSYVLDGKTIHVKSAGSARQYFYDSSNGQYDPQFDVVGPVKVKKKAEYYGKNAGGFDAHPWTMVREACDLVNKSVDFSRYDNDNDGFVDFVYVIYAGYGEADGGGENTIWPHSYALSKAGEYCVVDNKEVELYACGNELDFETKHTMGIGPFCHEFSHVLGLPDLYTTGGQGHKTVGKWSIMDYGPYSNEANTPPTYSAYERFMLGWLKPRLLVEPEEVELQELQASNSALLISTTDTHNLIGNNPNPATFYLLENRQQTGWDTHLPGHGLMLTKVQYSYDMWDNNTINNDANNMGVDLIEADGEEPRVSNDGYRGKAEDLFPAGATEYLKIENRPIRDIQEHNGVVRFLYKLATGVENVETEETVVAIYNILGQKQSTLDVATLPHGTYVVVTSAGNHKIVR